MTPQERNLEKLRTVFSLLKNEISKEDFLEYFKKAMELITKMGVNLDSKIAKHKEEMDRTMKDNNQAMGGIDAKYTSVVNKIKADYETDMASVKKEAMDYCMEQMKGMMMKHDQRMTEMERKNHALSLNMPAKVEKEIKKLRDEVLDLIPTIEQIEKDLPKLGEPIRDALELLHGDNRLDKSAIKGLQEELDRILQMVNSRGINIGGGLSIPRTTDVDDETPTGTIDGSNTTFTLNYTPINGSIKVFRGGARQTVTEDYTISGTTITFLIAPQVGEIIRVDYKR